MAARQLTLIPAAHDWSLDAVTRQRGRRGIARARAALAAHKPDDRTTHERNPLTTTITTTTTVTSTVIEKGA